MHIHVINRLLKGNTTDISIVDVPDAALRYTLSKILDAARISSADLWMSLAQYLQKNFVIAQAYEAMYRKHKETANKVVIIDELLSQVSSLD